MIRKFLTSTLLTLAAISAANAQIPVTGLSGDVKLMIGNDLGRNGYYEQKPIAELMGKVAEAVGPDAFLALGDIHHYLGIESVNDPLWTTNYELMYSHPELQVEWCPVLGNHEYRGNTQAVMDYSGTSRRWNMPSRYYTRIFDNDGTRVKVVFIDTAPIIDKYHANTAEYPDAGRQDVDAQLRWLDRELSRDDNADWTIVAGHHPVYAQTPKQSSERTDMQKRWIRYCANTKWTCTSAATSIISSTSARTASTMWSTPPAHYPDRTSRPLTALCSAAARPDSPSSPPLRRL